MQGQGFLSIFNDLSSELMPHERSLLELMEGLDYKGFDSSLRRNANVDPKDMAIIIVYSYMMGHTSSRTIERLCRRDLFIISVLRVLKTTEFNQNRPLILTKRNITDFNQNMAECSRNTIISLSSAI